MLGTHSADLNTCPDPTYHVKERLVFIISVGRWQRGFGKKLPGGHGNELLPLFPDAPREGDVIYGVKQSSKLAPRPSPPGVPLKIRLHYMTKGIADVIKVTD